MLGWPMLLACVWGKKIKRSAPHPAAHSDMMRYNFKKQLMNCREYINTGKK